MQLTVRDVSRLLNVPESKVTRWIKQDGLPSRRVDGKYHFSRVDLLEWATTRQLKVAAEVFDHLDGETPSASGLADALELGGIHGPVRAANQEQALRALAEFLPLSDGVDRDVLLRLFLAREGMASTAIGDGIALPHVRNPIVLHVERPLVTLCYLEQPVDFNALDRKPVHALFSLVCPTVRSHLQTLSRLTYALHDEGFKQAVIRRALSEEILREARRVEGSLAETNRSGGSR